MYISNITNIIYCVLSVVSTYTNFNILIEKKNSTIYDIKQINSYVNSSYF